MKAVAAALVLIAGAAVVLWFGDTLNSWVLGGLIGGLAALLLSIPISLTLFSYLSRRHDERVREEAQEEMYLAQVHDYQDYQRAAMLRTSASQAVEGYMVADEMQAQGSGEEELYQLPQRALPSPIYEPSQDAASFSSSASQKLPATRRSTHLAPIPPQRRTGLSVSPTKAKETPTRRTTRHVNNYPGFPGYQPSTRSQLQAAALHTARLEAAQQYDELDLLPTHLSRQMKRSTRHLNRPTASAHAEQFGQPAQEQEHLRATRQQAARRTKQPRQAQTRSVVDSTPALTEAYRALPPAHTTQRSPQPPHTDYLRDHPGYPQTEPIRQSARQTGQIVRNPHLDGQIGQQHASDEETGPIQHTLQRRAPYMYDDDPLRQQFAQQLNGAPSIRRSSRLQQVAQEDEEE
jgi:hypothetical protein